MDCLVVVAWLVRLFFRHMWRVGLSYLSGRPAGGCAGLPKGYAGDDLALKKTPQTCPVSPRLLRKLPERPYGRGITLCRGRLVAFPQGGMVEAMPSCWRWDVGPEPLLSAQVPDQWV
jgi:hypothetical protein